VPLIIKVNQRRWSLPPGGTEGCSEKMCSNVPLEGKGNSTAERWVLELILVLGSQPVGDVRHKPSGRLPLLSARPAFTLATLRGLQPISLLGEQRHDQCEQFAYDYYPTASRLRFEPRPFCA